MTAYIRHGSCGRQWTGANVGHCGGCHKEFAGLTAFDRHQRMHDGESICLDPAEAGLVARPKPWGVLYGLPEPTPEQRARLGWGSRTDDTEDDGPPEGVPGT